MQPGLWSLSFAVNFKGDNLPRRSSEERQVKGRCILCILVKVQMELLSFSLLCTVWFPGVVTHPFCHQPWALRGVQIWPQHQCCSHWHHCGMVWTASMVLGSQGSPAAILNSSLYELKNCHRLGHLPVCHLLWATSGDLFFPWLSLSPDCPSWQRAPLLQQLW